MAKMKDSGVAWIGEIPEGWEIVKFKNLFSFGRGLPITKADLLERGLPVINYGQIHSKQNDGVNLTDNLIRFVSPLFLESDASSLLNNGDFVFADTSEDVEGIGNAILVKHDKPIFAGYHTVICRPKFSGISRYFAYLFTTDLWRDQLRQLASGIKVFSITQTILSKVLLLIPPKEIQQKISSYLDCKCAQIDAILVTIQQSIEKLKEYRQAVIRQAVTKGLNPDAKMKDSDVKWIGEIPEDWEKNRLRFLCRISTGGKDTKDKIPDGKFPFFVRSPEIERIDSYSYDGEAILMAGDGVGAGKVFHYFNGKFDYHQRVYNLHQINRINGRFLFYYLQATFPIRIEVDNAKSTVDSVRLPMLLDFPVVFGTKEEQNLILSFIDRKCAQIDSLISEKQNLHDKLTAYKKSLIYEYVTGKREVSDGSFACLDCNCQKSGLEYTCGQ